MLSRSLKRVLLDSKWPLPPLFLLPWAAHLTTVSHSADTPTTLPPMPKRFANKGNTEPREAKSSTPATIAPDRPSAETPALPSPASSTSTAATTPLHLSPSLREWLPLLKAQTPHYITIHLHGKPYLLTQGDIVRLPFLMHGVEPGDILRLNRAIVIGSRDYTLKPSAPAPRIKSPTADTRNVIDPTTGVWASESQVMPATFTSSAADSLEITPTAPGVQFAPHFIPHIEKGKHSYIDERLFVCRAVVMGVESEPLRVKEKTKRRQRRVKRVKSKHRFTVLRIKEVRVRGVEELEGGDLD